MKLVQMKGKKVGRWTVGTHVGYGRWECVCECGNRSIVSGKMMRQGKSRSCGCLLREMISVRSRTHGYKGTRTYRIWTGIKNRCLNPNAHDFPSYAGRGITVCESWMKFENFLSDMGDAPDGMTIERIDNNKGYCASNCKWATAREQAQNRRSTLIVSINGIKKSASEWDRQYGFFKGTVAKRVRNKWKESDLLKPINKSLSRDQKRKCA